MRQIISNFHSSSHSESLKFNIIFHQESFKENACENIRVGPTGFLQSDDDAKLKIDEF